MQVGQTFLAFDPEQGVVAQGRITEIGRAAVRCDFEVPTAASVQRALRCCLVQGLGKADKPERVVRAATELGVDAVLFTRMQRSVATLEHHSESRLGRLRAVALDAARQSGRPDLPRLEYAADLQQALQRVPAGTTRLLCDPSGEAGLATRLAQGGQLQAVAVIVGPEGGLTSQEFDLAVGAGFLPCAPRPRRWPRWPRWSR
jgi:16S rRNA (uracil1498-N3)-methyltransferase